MIDFGRIDTKRLDPAFLRGLRTAIEPLSALWIVTLGFRTTAEQAAYYQTFKAGGPKAAPPGLSPHEYGFATDVVLDVDGKLGGAVSWDTVKYARQWHQLWAAIDASPILHSGRFFGDGDHIERVKWRRFVTARAA